MKRRTAADGTKHVALYLRVSTGGQTVENQRRELEEVAGRHGWEIVAVFADEGVSGSKGREKRPAFDALYSGIVRREFDIVAAWSVDRLGRSLQHLVEFLGEMKAKGVDLYLHQQGLDTSTPAGRAMFQMLGVFAEFERAMIQERVRSGLARAKSQGKTLGRPRVGKCVINAVLVARERGASVRQIAREIGVGVGTVHRVIAAAATA